MLKPLIKIDGFDKGITLDPTKPIRNGFNFCSGIDIFSEPGIMKVSQELSAMTEAAATNNITDQINWMTKFSDNSKVYGLGAGRLYDYDNTEAGKWKLAHADANTGVGNGLFEFDDDLFWSSNTHLAKFDGVTTFTDSFQVYTADDNAWHPKTEFLGKLMIGDGQYIATLDADDTWNATALTLPAGYRVRSIKVFGDRLAIGTWRGTNINDFPEATLFTWDGDVTHTYENAWTISETGIRALYPWRNNLICFAGNAGNIYTFNGSSLDKIEQLPDFGKVTGSVVDVLPGAVTEYLGNLIFGLSAGTSSAAMAPYYGIYTLGQAIKGDPISLTKSYILSGGEQNDMEVSALFQGGSNSFWSAFNYGTTFGVDALDIANTLDGGYAETQIYKIAGGDIPSLLQGVECVMDPLVATSNVEVSYKLDNAATYTSLGTITASNQHQIMKGINARAKNIQIKLVLVHSGTGSGNTSPRLSEINIY